MYLGYPLHCRVIVDLKWFFGFFQVYWTATIMPNGIRIRVVQIISAEFVGKSSVKGDIWCNICLNMVTVPTCARFVAKRLNGSPLYADISNIITIFTCVDRSVFKDSLLLDGTSLKRVDILMTTMTHFILPNNCQLGWLVLKILFPKQMVHMIMNYSIQLFSLCIVDSYYMQTFHNWIIKFW